MTDVVSGTEAEVTELTGIDLDGAPPCQCLKFHLWEFRKAWMYYRGGPDLAHECRRPSTARLRISCRDCGAGYRLFLCARHVRAFRRGLLVGCRICSGQVRGA